MTISSTTSRISYTGNGAVDTYSYTFRIQDEDHLLVTVRDTDDVETVLVINTDYSVTGVGAASGGTVVLVNSAQAWLDGDGDLLTDYVLTIRRVVPLLQETDIRNQGVFYPEGHEDEFDLLVMADQQQQDEIDRSVKLPETIDIADFDPTLPTEMTASHVLRVNEDGDGFELVEMDNGVSTVTGSRASPQAIVAGTGITPTASTTREVLFIQGSGGAVDVSANPQVAAGSTVGQQLILIGRSDTNTVTLEDGNGLSLNGPVIMGADFVLCLLWDGVNWIEIYRRED